MIWPWRIIVVVPAASKDAAETAARLINSTGPDYQGNAFTGPLSASGNEPVTHWALYTSATDEMVAKMGTAISSIDGVQYWRHGVDGLLAASNVTDPKGQAWGWQEAMKAAGLVVIQSSSPVS
jgi:hypothetical protein